MLSDPSPTTIGLVTALTTTARSRGRVVVIKQRQPIDRWLVPDLEAVAQAQARAQTQAEAAWLAEARHPGVVALRRVGTAGAWLETDLCGVHSLRTVAGLGPLTVPAVAGALAAVAHTLVDLHRRGLTHGNLALEHLIVPDRHHLGQPILCSPASEADGHEGAPGDDLIGLAAVAEALGPQIDDRRGRWTELVGELGRAACAAEAIDALTVVAGRARRRRWGRR